MHDTATPRTADEIGLAADELLRAIEPTLPPTDAGRFICVDINTGAYEVDDDDMAVVDRLHARVPGAESYLSRVGEDRVPDALTTSTTALTHPSTESAQRRTADEIGDLGDDLLHRVIEPMLPASENGRYIAVDVDSAEYEVDDDDRRAADRLRARVPAAEIWLSRVREDAADRMGFRW